MKVTINGKICEAREGEYILNVARREGVFIPALCYLTGCSPTLACRLCMVEADGKRVYSCNAKVKDDMQIVTSSPEIAAERNAIMQSYCVNHPLQCGVCDQSGECELQNFTQKMRVNSQNYAIKDTHKPHKKWGLINYDPALCIVCERCVTVCKDKIGESALKTVPRGADQVPKEMKDAMPKDAFAVWSRLQKSLIAPSEGDALDCSFCGECVSVCPVGALISSDFQYSSNAWELRRVPAANPHFSDCELLYYEVKPHGIEDRREKIYRVTNDFHFGELNGAARWGFDFHDPGARKDEAKFAQIVSKFKDGSIKNIKFNSFITNEEALILERLREKFNLSLINDEARAYQAFLEGFSQACGRSVYSGDTNELKNSDFIVVAGSMLRYDAPNVSYRVNNALTINKASGFYFHPIADAVTRKYSKNFDVIAHEAGLEEQILLLLLAKFGRDLPREVGEFLDGFKFTEQKTVKKSVTREVTEKIDGQSGILEEATKQIAEEVEEIIELQRLKFASELGLSEERLDALAAGKERKILIIGEDFYRSPRAAALAKYAGLIERYAGFKLILIPPRTNSLGVAKICKLSAKPQAGATLGYNEAGDFKFCVHGGDIDAGALNQQEGTFTSVDARVTPTNAALAHEGYFLNDLSNALRLRARYTIDYTPQLPVSAGFKAVKFDDLQNFYDNGGTAHRGYKLENLALNSSKAGAERAQIEISARDLDARRQENGENLERNFSDFPQPLGARKFNLYHANPIGVTLFSARSRQLAQTGALFASPALAAKLGLSRAAIIEKGAIKLGVSVKIDKNLEGEVAYLGDFDPMMPYEEIFEGARFAQVEISPVSGEFLNLNSAKILDAADENEK